MRIEKAKLRKVLHLYRDVFATSQFDVGEIRGEENEFRIAIKPNEESAIGEQRCRDLVGPKLAEAERQIKDLEARGMIRKSTSQFASPILLVPKPRTPGEWRLCVDFRRLNSHTIPDAYPL